MAHFTPDTNPYPNNFITMLDVEHGLCEYNKYVKMVKKIEEEKTEGVAKKPKKQKTNHPLATRKSARITKKRVNKKL